MGGRFRIWMPLTAVLIVLLSVSLTLLYGLPVARARLESYAQERVAAQVAAAADRLGETGGQDPQRSLDLVASTSDREVLLVDRNGKVVGRAGPRLLAPEPRLLEEAARGGRAVEKVRGLNVALTPVVYDGDLAGGVVLVSEEAESIFYRLFLRSSFEAAMLASLLGGGLMLLLATLLSRRVERLVSGARSIERGDFSHRLEPGFEDELGELAKSFNSMATKLESSFGQLQEKSTTLSVLINNLTEGVLATDSTGRVVFANGAARTMLGISHEELPEKVPDPWKDFSLPEAVTRCAKEREGIEARVVGAQTFTWVKLEYVPEFDCRKGGVLVVTQDLSEGRRLEANQQRFLANATHELKTPLATIIGASELLLTGEEEDPETRRRFLNHIHSEARRMQRLSETLLRLARTGVDLRNPNLRETELYLAQKVAECIEPLAQAAGVTLCLEDRGGCVRADREWLEQALIILLSNAIKHSERGGRVWLRVGGGKITVEDEGEGISEEHLPHVFERHYRGRADPDRDGIIGGFGLGLSICKELVERMGGKISLESEKGVGTVVEIELPEVD